MDSAKKHTLHHKPKDKEEELEDKRVEDLNGEDGGEAVGEDVNPSPKINFDYPPKAEEVEDGADEETEPMAPAQDPANLDDLDGDETENRPTRANPYVEEEMEEVHHKPIHPLQSSRMAPFSNHPGGRMSQGGAPMMNDNNLPGYTPNNNFQFRREGGSSNPNRSSKAYFFVLFLIGLVVLGGAVYLLKNQLKVGGPPAPSPTPEVTISTPAPSPTPEALDRSKFTVRVLNGTGKTGLAATVSEKLKTLGYKIEKTGNASSAAQTTVRVKAAGADLAAQLIKDLTGEFEASSQANLKDTDPSDAEVILGAK